MYMNKFYILLFFVSISIGCSRISSDVKIISLKDNLQSEISICDLFEDLTYVTIDSSDSSSAPLIGMITKSLLYDNKIYISDLKNIHIYDLSGAFITMLSRYGRGSNEYLGINDFAVYDDQILILDQNKKLLKYAIDGTCLQSLTLDFYPSSLCVVDSEQLLLTSAYQAEEDKFHVYNLNTLEKVNSFYPIEKPQITWRHFRGQTNFYRYKDKLLYHEPMNNTLYNLRDTTLMPIMNVDLFGRNAPDDFWQRTFDNVMDINLEANDQKYCFGIPSYCENDDNLWFTYRDGANYRICLYSKDDMSSIQSSNISIPELSANISVDEIYFSLESDHEQMMVITGDMLNEDVKVNILNVSADYDNPIFIINR